MGEADLGSKGVDVGVKVAKGAIPPESLPKPVEMVPQITRPIEVILVELGNAYREGFSLG